MNLSINQIKQMILVLVAGVALGSSFAASAMQSTKRELNKQLVAAAELGKLDEVKRLLKSGADVNAKEFLFGNTALMQAADNGHGDVVKHLLACGANVYAKNFHGITALYCAGMTDRQQCCELLVEEMLRPIKQKEAVHCFLCCWQRTKGKEGTLGCLPKDIVRLIAKDYSWVKIAKTRDEIKKEISEMRGELRETMLDKYFPDKDNEGLCTIF